MGRKMPHVLCTLVALTIVFIIVINTLTVTPLLTIKSFERVKYHDNSLTNMSDSSLATGSYINLVNSAENTIKILIWQKQHVIRHNFPVGRNLYNNCNLPQKKTCENVVDRKLYDMSEAVLFHGKNINTRDMPKYRHHHHKWGFYEYETPPNTWTNQNYQHLYRNSFNFSITLNPNADIPITRVLKNCYIDNKKLETLRNKKLDFTKGKGGNVAWFVSHCKTQSRRELYVKELSKYIPVDIYGRCGKKKCGSSMNRKNCDTTVLDQQYKFYLSFENSLCGKLNYVTEKLTRILFKPITAIPIVLGGVDYKSFFPNVTYIDVKNFSSPKQLAMHLERLNADNDAFNEMILMKNALTCKQQKSQGFSYACRLCDFLHKNRNKVLKIPDIMKEYSTSKLCESAHSYYGSVLRGV